MDDIKQTLSADLKIANKSSKMLYLHGFRSSPQSFKARLLADHMQQQGQMESWACPALPTSPDAAIATAQKILEKWGAIKRSTQADPTSVDKAQVITLIGSSLGGFYATYLAEQYGCRCVLLNPAMTPAKDIQAYLGEQKLWHGGGSIIVEPCHLVELERYAIKTITHTQRYFLIAATGDEVIDYRQMLAHYRGVKTKLIQGGNHSLSDFAEHLSEVVDFCRGHR